MLKKIVLAALAVYALWVASSYLNDKVMRKYFMPLIKFKDLVAEDNMSEREEKFGFKSKIWLYHVNSPQKLSKYFNEYEGFEVDVIYDAPSRSFIVGRKNEEANITLDDMFAAQPDMSNKYFWLDIKNIDFNNKSEILRGLIAVTGRNIMHKSHLIIASGNPEYLDEFVNNGFLTAYYFPQLNRVKRGDIRGVLEESTEKYKSSTVDFVSGDVRYFNFMDYYFPEAPKMYWNVGREAKQINPYLVKRPDTFVVLNQEAEEVKRLR